MNLDPSHRFRTAASMALALVWSTLAGVAPADAQDGAAAPSAAAPEASPVAQPVAEPESAAIPEPAPHHPVTGLRIGGGIRLGTYLNADGTRARGAINPQQFGFDGFLGFSFPGGLYIGGGMRLFLGQKTSAGTFMAQQFNLDVGYVFQVDAKLGIRPTIELGFLRYGQHVSGVHDSDFGPMAAGGIDILADVLPHLFLGAGGRMGFALMGKDATDIRLSSGSIDVYMQFGAFAGLRF